MSRRRKGPGLRHRWQRRLRRWLRPEPPLPAPAAAPCFAPAVDGPPRLVAYLPTGSQGWILDYLWRDLCNAMQGIGHGDLTLATAASTAELAEQIHGCNAYVLVMFQGHLRRLFRDGMPPERVLLYFTHVRLGLALPDLRELCAVLVLNAFEQALVEMQGVVPAKVHRFPAGYDPRLFHPPQEGCPRSIDVLFVGRYQSVEKNSYYYRRKRFGFQVALANQLVAHGLKVTILGDHWQHSRESLDPRVQCLVQPHASYGEVYRQARLVCSVAAQEGGPVSFLEGLASGCLMLSTPTGFAGDWTSDSDGVHQLPLTATVEDWRECVMSCLRMDHTQEPSLSSARQAFLREASFPRLAERLGEICWARAGG